MIRRLADARSNCEPLTPDDIAEIVVFAAGRRENVLMADTLVFPSHQVSVRVSLLDQPSQLADVRGQASAGVMHKKS